MVNKGSKKKAATHFRVYQFVDEVTFHADRMNIPQIFHHGQTATNSTSTSYQPRRKLPRSITLTSKTGNANRTLFPESKKETSAKKSSENSSVVKKLSLFHKTKTHTLNECQNFRELSLDVRREFLRKTMFQVHGFRHEFP